jgi:hypothetical protein
MLRTRSTLLETFALCGSAEHGIEEEGTELSEITAADRAMALKPYRQAEYSYCFQR